MFFDKKLNLLKGIGFYFSHCIQTISLVIME